MPAARVERPLCATTVPTGPSMLVTTRLIWSGLGLLLRRTCYGNCFALRHEVSHLDVEIPRTTSRVSSGGPSARVSRTPNCSRPLGLAGDVWVELHRSRVPKPVRGGLLRRVLGGPWVPGAATVETSDPSLRREGPVPRPGARRPSIIAPITMQTTPTTAEISPKTVNARET